MNQVISDLISFVLYLALDLESVVFVFFKVKAG